MFESVASIVSQHQPVVERYYGLGHMHIVIKILLSRCSSTCAQMLSDWESSQSLSSRAALSRQIMHSIQNEANFNRICSLSEGRLEARPVDVLLTELATVRGRWQLLRKFVWDHLEVCSNRHYRLRADAKGRASSIPRTHQRTNPKLALKGPTRL